ncbi:hypothetical protein YWIDRAFT_07463 [Streptomyces sp. SceaMP-e96]|nr:hypothetical protein [Streptomyces sp. SID4951]SCK47135.1 hypothetical protein YWIDRAFT_07463 [Streptomyces sp. SceaMP-e96]
MATTSSPPTTSRSEQQIQKSGTRYEVLDTYTSDHDPSEAWTLVRDSRATRAPVRLFYEEWNHGADTYTMREGAFADAGVAQTWMDERSGPLPEPPKYSNGAAVRARIALARSAGVCATPQTGLGALRTTAAGPVQRPVRGRLL